MRDIHDLRLKGRLPESINNFLSNRTFRSILDLFCRGQPPPKKKQEVAQGSILSVALFSIKINNIAKEFPRSINGSLYRDDFAVSDQSNNIPHHRKLQRCRGID